MNRNRLLTSLTITLSVLLFAGGTAYFAKGLRLSWGHDNDGDMKTLWNQYSLFEQGIYPHRGVAEAAGMAGVRGSAIYPPYAFPMLSACFWTPDYRSARALYQALTFAALGFLMWYGAKQMEFAGRPAALLGAAMPFAISGNGSAVSLGQFTIICVGFLALQIVLLQRNRPALAGVCWAFAMLKPHIALPFGVLFLLGPHWRGVLAGGLTLASLTALALWWTNVDPRDFWTQGVVGHRLKFVETTSYGSGLWVGAWGLNAQKATLFGIGIAGLFGVLLLLPRVREKFNLQTTAAVAAVMAMTLFYHRPYDNLLFIFLLLPLVAAAFRGRSLVLSVASAALAVVLYLPAGVALRRLAEIAPVTDWLVAVIPVTACAILLLATRSRSDSTPPPA